MNPSTYPLQLPAGYGFVLIPPSQWPGDEDLPELMDKVLIWEPPRLDQLYVIGVDVGDGLGLDRSVIDVCRVGTVAQPDEQVAQFVSDTTDPVDLAKIIDPIGRFYRGKDGASALLAVEVNNHGIATQSELQRHIGYDNFFIWQYEDALDESRRMSNRIGWQTSQRTRPLILSRYLYAVKTIDKITGLPNYIVNSPFTVQDMRDFVTPPGMPLALAEAAPGAFDDCIMSGAISVHVSQTVQHESGETVADTRQRKAAEQARADHVARLLKEKRDWRNTDATADEMKAGREYEDDIWYGN